MEQAIRETAFRQWKILVGFVVLGVVLVVGEFAVPTTALVHGFLGGLVAALVVAGIGWLIWINSGEHNRLMGVWGEDFTAEVLDSRLQQSQGWRTINGLYFWGHGDVDHIRVGPGGVFAVESKFTSRPWSVSAGGLSGPVGQDSLGQARRGARKVQLALQHGWPRFDVDVHPVLVIWGPGAPHLDDGWAEIDGVLVCEGRQDRKWIQQFDRSDLGPDQIRKVSAFLEYELDRRVGA